MPEPILLLLGVLAAAALVVPPLLRPTATDAFDTGERDAAAVRHRVALETLRDVEADRRAGSLDDAAYAEQLADAEARAAATRAALESASAGAPDLVARPDGGGVRVGLLAAGAIGVALLAGAMLPPTGIANRTVVNQSLADAQDAEAARQARIAELLSALQRDGADAAVLSDLADAYLAG